MLFDNFQRTEDRFPRRSEQWFDYLNISAKPDIASTREILETWVARYPEKDRVDLIGRLRSDNINHHSAFYEMLLHEVFFQRSCILAPHPNAPNSSYHPDFLVKTKNGDGFYLEAIVARDESKAELAIKNRMNVVYDLLNEIELPNYYLKIICPFPPNVSPSVNKIKAFLKKVLEEVNQSPEKVQPGKKWIFKDGDYEIPFGLIPRSKPGKNAIGITSERTRSGFGDHLRFVMQAIISKAQKYGRLDLPYVIAVNPFPWPIDLQELEKRINDEIWKRFGQTVSALLVSEGVTYWNFYRDAKIHIYPSPALNRDSLPIEFLKLDSSEVREVLRLSKGWPDLHNTLKETE